MADNTDFSKVADSAAIPSKREVFKAVETAVSKSPEVYAAYREAANASPEDVAQKATAIFDSEPYSLTGLLMGEGMSRESALVKIAELCPAWYRVRDSALREARCGRPLHEVTAGTDARCRSFRALAEECARLSKAEGKTTATALREIVRT